MNKKFKKISMLTLATAMLGCSLVLFTKKAKATEGTDPYTCNMYCHYDFLYDCTVYINPIYGGGVYSCEYMYPGKIVNPE